MKKVTILLIALMVISVGLLSGCTDTRVGSMVKPPNLSMSEEEFKESCIRFISYEQLDSKPDFYEGFKVTYLGIIDQIFYTDNGMEFRLDIGNWNDVYVFTNKILDLIESDIVEIWGVVLERITYTSILGWEITTPAIWAHFVEKLDNVEVDMESSVFWNGLDIALTSAERTDTYDWRSSSDRVYTEYATPGKDFIRIFVSVKYYGLSSSYIYAGDFELVDDTGFKYEYEWSGTTFESRTLYAEQSNSGYITFEVPENRENLTIEYNFASTYRPLLAYWSLEGI